MRAILTGASGFIGTNLFSFLRGKGWSLETIGRSDTLDSIDEKMREFRPDVVFHLGTYFVSEHRSSDIDLLIQSNISFGAHVVDAMARNKISNLVNTGTLWQYFHGDRNTPSSLYAGTKSAFECLLRFYSSNNGIKVLNLMLSDTFGPKDPRAKILPKLFQIAGTSETLSMSPGEQVIEWTYIGDVVSAFEVAALRLIQGEEKQNFSHYTATSGEQHTLKETVSICERILGKKIQVSFGAKPYRAREIMRPYKLDASLPGWKAKVSFEEGIRSCLYE